MPRLIKREIRKSLLIRSPVDRVAALIEDVNKTPKWNPLVVEIRRGKGRGIGRGSVVKWKARLAGVTIEGDSVATIWKPRKEYGWRNSERISRRSLEGHFILTPTDGHTSLTAVVSYELPNEIAAIVSRVALTRLLNRAVERALGNIDRLATRGHNGQ